MCIAAPLLTRCQYPFNLSMFDMENAQDVAIHLGQLVLCVVQSTIIVIEGSFSVTT